MNVCVTMCKCVIVSAYVGSVSRFCVVSQVSLRICVSRARVVGLSHSVIPDV